ncbi:RHS repeat-associated core domain-containing protein, partial [Puniceicoccaceae bacterium K14]|nr:RHS repeat-associated core domain-containing protein [Puniceicoccaceae bacterium K14]
TYTRGLDIAQSLDATNGIGALLAVRQGDGDIYYAQADNVGHITAYLDESGQVSASYQYDTFGDEVGSTGIASEFNYRALSKYYDSETGLVQYFYRYYNAEDGRWTNRDPIEEQGGYNLYGMIGNDTVNRIDILGLQGTWGFGGHSGPRGYPRRPLPRDLDDSECSDDDGCPKFSRLGMAGDNAFAWRERKERQAEEWSKQYEKYGELIDQVADRNYNYAPRGFWNTNGASIGRPKPPIYWEVNGSWLNNTIESMQSSVVKSSGGRYQAGDIIDDPTAGRNMSPTRTNRAGGVPYILKLGQHLLGTRNQYTIGMSSTGDGFFVASNYRNGVYLGPRAPLRDRYLEEDRGRQIIDEIAQGYESLTNPYLELIERCTKKWRDNPSSQYR